MGLTMEWDWEKAVKAFVTLLLMAGSGGIGLLFKFRRTKNTIDAEAAKLKVEAAKLKVEQRAVETDQAAKEESRTVQQVWEFVERLKADNMLVRQEVDRCRKECRDEREMWDREKDDLHNELVEVKTEMARMRGWAVSVRTFIIKKGYDFPAWIDTNDAKPPTGTHRPLHPSEEDTNVG